MKRQTPLLIALALLAGPVRAETVEASSSTFLNLGSQTRYRGGSTPEVITVAPVYEILNVTARDISLGTGNDLRLVLSTWGVWNLGGRRWDAGTDARLTGDVTTGYVQARFFQQHLTLRLGRTMVATGVARMIQLDGGELVVVVPLGPVQASVSAYAGVPTAQRFQGRGGLVSWNPVAGNLAYGGRGVLSLPIGGAPGRGLEVGLSANVVCGQRAPGATTTGDTYCKNADVVREETGVDARLQPFSGTDLAVSGFGTYSRYDRRWSEASAALTVSPMMRLHLDASWRYVEPSLLLARNSILSVFTASTWSEYGLGGRYDLGRGLHAGLDLRLRSEPGKDGSSKRSGSDVAGRLDWESGVRSAGVELSNLDTFDNGYFGFRLYGRRELARLVLTGDVLAQVFRKDVNGQHQAVTGTLTAAYKLPHDFAAVVAGSAGMTPYLKQSYNLMVKLAYNQYYRTEEHR